MTGRMELRKYYENRRNETDADKIREYLEEGQGMIKVLSEGLMQVEVTETDQFGNPTGGGIEYSY